MYRVTISVAPSASQTIAACRHHITAVMSELNTTAALIEIIPDAYSTCMGCMKGWRYDE